MYVIRNTLLYKFTLLSWTTAQAVCDNSSLGFGTFVYFSQVYENKPQPVDTDQDHLVMVVKLWSLAHCVNNTGQ